MDNLKEPIEGISTRNVAASAICNGPRARTVTTRSATKIMLIASHNGCRCRCTEPCAAMLQRSETKIREDHDQSRRREALPAQYRAITRV